MGRLLAGGRPATRSEREAQDPRGRVPVRVGRADGERVAALGEPAREHAFAGAEGEVASRGAARAAAAAREADPGAGGFRDADAGGPAEAAQRDAGWRAVGARRGGAGGGAA